MKKGEYAKAALKLGRRIGNFELLVDDYILLFSSERIAHPTKCKKAEGLLSLKASYQNILLIINSTFPKLEYAQEVRKELTSKWLQLTASVQPYVSNSTQQLDLEKRFS